MDLRDIPIIGTVASFAALLVDLVFYGGDMLLSLVAFALLSPDSWVSMMLYLETLAMRLEWLPRTLIEDMLIIGVTLLVVWYGVGFVHDWRDSRD